MVGIERLTPAQDREQMIDNVADLLVSAYQAWHDELVRRDDLTHNGTGGLGQYVNTFVAVHSDVAFAAGAVQSILVVMDTFDVFDEVHNRVRLLVGDDRANEWGIPSYREGA